jgi:hypothetical protein
MNKKNFNKIVEQTNFFFNYLINNKINIVKYCDFFYVLNAHPLNLKKYFFFKNKKYNFIFFFIVLIESIKNIIYIFYRFLDKNYFYSINNKKVDVVFFSHLINSSHLNNNKDFYFGKLPKLLNKSSITVLNNQTELSHSQLIKNNNNKKNIIVLSKYVGFKNELIILRSVFSNTIKLLAQKKNFKSKQKIIIFKNLILNILNQSTFKNIRFSMQVIKILQIYSPKKILFTFEGHCYEKIIIDTVKSYNKSIECIAYQHSIIFPNQPSLLRPNDISLQPDKILTSGLKGKNILKSIYNKSKIYVIGNHRHKKKKIDFNKKKNICLLIPDGTTDETKKMLELVPKKKFLKNCNIEFLVRLHPGMSNFFLNNDNLNLKFSKNSLSQDLENCSWAVYRGSAAIVHCLGHGIRPIYYYYNKKDLSIDPLHDLRKFKKKICNFKELNKLIKFDINKNFPYNDKDFILDCSASSNFYFSEMKYSFAKRIILL